jgi:hypothetical protein
MDRKLDLIFHVMAALEAAIHVQASLLVDGRVKPGHDILGLTVVP